MFPLFLVSDTGGSAAHAGLTLADDLTVLFLWPLLPESWGGRHGSPGQVYLVLPAASNTGLCACWASISPNKCHTQAQAVLSEGAKTEEELKKKKRVDGEFPKHSRQLMNHMQMRLRAQT